MVYLLGGLAIAGVVGLLAGLFLRGNIRTLVKVLRYGLGWGAIALGGVMLLTGRAAMGGVIGMAGAALLSRGRLGPIDFGAGIPSASNTSTVTSRYLDMELDHDTGAVSGTVREGAFARADLIDLDAEQCWQLYGIVDADPDSKALFESWLDANRAGWRQYFAEHYDFAASGADEEAADEGANVRDPLSEAYDILGLSPGASEDDVRSAHRALMKKVHPDHGGSSYLAAQINEAKDRLLAALAARRA